MLLPLGVHIDVAQLDPTSRGVPQADWARGSVCRRWIVVSGSRARPRITRCGVVPRRRQSDALRVGALSSRQAPAPVEALYRRYRRDVLALAYTNVGNRADAEDLAQTTFLNAHRAIVGGAQPTNERAWLLAIARNLCRKRFHGLAQRPREEPFDESHHPTEAEDAGAEHDVVAAINTLPPRQREAIVLQAVHGCTTAEIGNRLGLGGAAVDALLFRARSALRDALEANAQPIACARTEALAAGQLAHELDCSEQAALRAHLRTCPQCASRVRSLRARKRIASLLTFPWELLSRIPGLAGANAGVGAKATIVLALTLGAAGVEGASPPPLPPSAASGCPSQRTRVRSSRWHRGPGRHPRGHDRSPRL